MWDSAACLRLHYHTLLEVIPSARSIIWGKRLGVSH